MKLLNFNWIPGLFLLFYHLVFFISLPLYLMHHTPHMGVLIVSGILLFATGVSITAGYHRLFAHNTYKAHPLVEAILVFFGTMATQGSVLRWANDHRIHHAFTDTDKDPYSIKKGFWYAHFLWLFEKPKPIEEKSVADLLRNPLLRFQEKHYNLLMFATNAIAFLGVGWWFHDFLGAFIFTWLTRLFLLHHFTWFINSLAHTWGSRRFCHELSAADNYIISLVTFGEGYHNYHHTFAHDYRNGIRWYHFDPSKWLIWTLSKCGLVSHLKKVDAYRIEEKILLDRKELLLENIQLHFAPQKKEWETKVTTAIDNALKKLQESKELKKAYLELKNKKEGKKEELRTLSTRLKETNKMLKKQLGECMVLSRHLTSR